MRRLLQHPAVHLASLAALCLVGYGGGLTRYFVSEDFVFLRRLSSSSLWEMTLAHLTGPQLEVTFVKFYRPVAGFLLDLEVLLWGTRPTGYLVTHLAFHVGNAALVYRLATVWSGGCAASAWGVASIFAVYPLHPNSVLFIASFATVWSASFLLISVLFYEMFRSRPSRWLLAASLVAFALGLGSYEQTVVLPVLLAARELLTTGARGQSVILRLRSLRPIAPFLVVLAGYFLVRQAALGEMVGGYVGFRQRFLAGELIELGRDVLTSLVYLIYPVYTYEVPGTAVFAVALLLLAASLWSLRRNGATASFWFLGLVYILASQAPFAFTRVIPGNGRYWYLTSIGLALLAVALARCLASGVRALAPRPSRGSIIVAFTGALALAYLIGLIFNTRVYAEAGRVTKTLQSQLVAARHDGTDRMFVAGHPDFVRNSSQTPIAQVFHWGLSDALAPPFVEPGPTVYPLPRRLSDADLLPILERPDLGPAWRWSPASGSLEPIPPPAASSLPRIDIQRHGPGAWRFRPTAGSHRLMMITRGSASVHPIAARVGSDGWIEMRPPADIVDSIRRLYDGEIFIWIEARSSGRLVAVSRLYRLDSEP